MNSRPRDMISPRIYPWWLILVGFVFGVIVTLVVTGFPHPALAGQSAYPQDFGLSAMQVDCYDVTTTMATDSGIPRSATLDPLLVMATQMVMDATRTAEAPLRARCTSIEQTATAIAIQANQPAPPQ